MAQINDLIQKYLQLGYNPATAATMAMQDLNIDPNAVRQYIERGFNPTAAVNMVQKDMSPLEDVAQAAQTVQAAVPTQAVTSDEGWGDANLGTLSNPVTSPYSERLTKAGGNPKSLKNWFSGLGLANSGWNLTGKSKLGIGNTGGKSGLVVGGKNIGKLGVGVGLGIDAVKSIKSLADQNNINTDSENLINNIKASAAGNPMLSSYLTSDQLDTLNKVKRGVYKSNSKASMFNSGMLSGGLRGALSGLAMGGLPGAALGAIGGGITGGLSNKTSQLQGNNAELSNLYQSLQDAEAQYKRMRVPNFTGLGLQSRYTNQWM